MAKKRAFMDGYKTYDPETEGYGDTSQWRNAFNERMNLDEAEEVLGGDDALSLLGLSKMPKLSELKKVYFKLMQTHHPDKGGDIAKAKKIIAAYTKLKDELS